MKEVKFFTVFFALSLLALAPFASADIPHLISLQGRLTDASNNPLTSSTNFAFSIYDAPTGGTALWAEFQTLAPDSLGIFNALLGSVTALNIPFNTPYWLEVKVNSEVLSPRQRMGSAGYALRSETPWNATGNNIFTTNTGNVGIGTTNPGAKLDVNGNVKANTIALKGTTPSASYPLYLETGNTGAFFRFVDTNAGGGSIQMNSGGPGTPSTLYINDPDGVLINQQNPGYLAFATTNSERVRIDSSGNVGIGTASPTNHLTVTSSWGAYTYPEAFSIYGTYPSLTFRSTTSNSVWLNHLAASNELTWYNSQTGAGAQDWSMKMSLDQNRLYVAGNVGIGTTGPARKLDVSGRLLVREGTIPNGWDTADWGAIVSLRRPGAASMASASDANAQLELVSDGPSTSHISFHRPGVYGANFGLDTDNWLSTQGWSAGAGYTNLRAGTIRSMSGGIQFPDGTTQTSAAIGGTGTARLFTVSGGGGCPSGTYELSRKYASVTCPSCVSCTTAGGWFAGGSGAPTCGYASSASWCPGMGTACCVSLTCTGSLTDVLCVGNP